MTGTGHYNFDNASIVVLDSDRVAAKLLAEMLGGFGVRNPYLVHDPDEANVLMQTGAVDAAIVTMSAKPDPVLDVIQNVRARAAGAARWMPIIALTGYAQHSHIARARDAGANLVVRRPIAPGTLFDRLVWTAFSPRHFVESENYRGPDRRFQDKGPPHGGGRRASDRPDGPVSAIPADPAQPEDKLLFEI